MVFLMIGFGAGFTLIDGVPEHNDVNLDYPLLNASGIFCRS